MKRALVSVLAMLICLCPSVGFAQDLDSLPYAPPPESCPTPTEGALARYQRLEGPRRTPTEAPAERAFPSEEDGTAASDEVAQQAFDILTALYACTNADSLLGETSLHSDEFFVWEILDSAFKEGMLPETVAASIDDDYPLALPRSRWSTIISIDEVRSYPDDAVTVLFTREAPDASPPQDARLAYFVMTEDGIKLQKMGKAPLKEGSGPVLDLSLVDILFVPNELTAPANTDVTIKIVNNGSAVHDFSIESLGIRTGMLSPGEVAMVVVNAPAGTYNFICTVPGHKEAGMVGTLTLVSESETTPTANEDEINLEVNTIDIAFEQKELTGPANQEFTITVTNKGAAQHDFSIPDLGITSEMLNPGQSTTVTVKAPAGTYQYICTVPGHKEAGMTGTLTLVAETDESAESGRSQMDLNPEQPAAANAIEVTANDIYFDPKTLEGPANTDIAITITNKGAATHSFAIPDLGITGEMIAPGQSVTVSVNAPAGAYQFICIVPGHKEAGMVGTLTLK